MVDAEVAAEAEAGGAVAGPRRWRGVGAAVPDGKA